MVFAIEGSSDDSFFFFFKGQVKSPILHNTRDGLGKTLCSLPYALYVILGRGLGVWV